MINFKQENLEEYLENGGNEYDAYLVGTNTYMAMSQGFQHAVSRDYPFVHHANMKTKYGDPAKVGTILECTQEGEPTFILMFISLGYNFRPKFQPDYLSYEGVEKCFTTLNALYKGKKFATTMIGCYKADGNGDRDKVLEILNKTCKDIEVTIFEYQQLTDAEIKRKFYDEEIAMKAIDPVKHRQMVTARKAKAQARREKNGHCGY